MKKYIFPVLAAVISILSTVKLHGWLEAVYLVGYVSLFLIIARSILGLYHWSILTTRRPIEVEGRVVAYYSDNKMTPRFSTGKNASAVAPITTWFNCIDVLTVDGRTFKVFESYNLNCNEKYSGKYRNGKSVKFRIRKCNSKYYMEEELFMKFYGVKS